MNFFKIKRIIIGSIKIILRIKSRIIVKKLSKMGIFNYIELSEKDIKDFSFNILQDNYGIGYILKKYANYRKNIFYSIEHGFYLGDYILEDEIKVKKIITFSEERKKCILSKKEIQVEKIGPYIYYAESFYSKEKLKELKNKYGKILLVFPSHSIDEIDLEYNIDLFITTINKIKKNFDNVFICLYYSDIKKGIYKKYLKEKYIIVTAGHKYDRKFLERLKSIILLADYSITNSFGTHTIYATSLNKPHTIFQQDMNIKVNGKINKNKLKFYNEAKRKDKKLIEQLNIIINNYNIYPNYNIENQKKNLNYLFGFSELKTKEEMYKLLGLKSDKNV